MPEVIGNCGVDVGQVQRVVRADQVFRRDTVLVLLDHYVEADTTFPNANGAPFIHTDGQRLGVYGQSISQVQVLQVTHRNCNICNSNNITKM